MGNVAALHPTTSRSGALLYLAPDGLRVLDPRGTERTLGWPIHFDVPHYPALLLRNARITPVHEGPVEDDTAGLSDILIVDGRISRIEAAGRVMLPPGVPGSTLDAGGRWVIPGLIDTHQHFYNTRVAVPREALRHGVTTIREMWGRLGVSAAYRDAVDAGVLTGARIVVSGPPFYTSPTGIPVTTDYLWLAADSADVDRGLALLVGMGAGHVKLRYVQSWSAGAQLVRQAHARGLPVSGHCAHALPIVVAGIDGLEHADGQCGDWEFGLREDLVRLFRAAGVVTTPIIHLHTATEQTEVAHRRAERARLHASRLHAGHARLVAGSDAPSDPAGLHAELESLVSAGLSNHAALLAATAHAAEAIGLSGQLGRIRVGYVADLLLLDADPLADIRNTRRIVVVVQGGRVVHDARERR